MWWSWRVWLFVIQTLRGKSLSYLSLLFFSLPLPSKSSHHPPPLPRGFGLFISFFFLATSFFPYPQGGLFSFPSKKLEGKRHIKIT